MGVEPKRKNDNVRFQPVNAITESILAECRTMEDDLSFIETNGEFLLNVIFYNGHEDGKSYLSSIKKLAKEFDITFKEYKNGEEIENKNAPYLIIGGTFYEQEIYAMRYGLKNQFVYSVDHFLELSVSESVFRALKSINRKIGKKVVVIGRSDNAFETAKWLEKWLDCTVTLVHTRTEDISAYTKEADCIVSFAGSPNLIKGRMVKDNAVIVPVGMKKDKYGEWLDDIDYDSIGESDKNVCIVQGIGPLTAALTLFKTIRFYLNRAVNSRKELKEKYGKDFLV